MRFAPSMPFRKARASLATACHRIDSSCNWRTSSSGWAMGRGTLSITPLTFRGGSTTIFGCVRRRPLMSLRCSCVNGSTCSICDRIVRNCAMTASGVNFVVSGTGLLMTSPPYVSDQAGGDVTTRRQARGGHRLEVPATRRSFRLMFPGVRTPTSGAKAGGAIQHVRTMKAAKAGGLKIFDFVTKVRISPSGGSVDRQECNRARGLCARTRAAWCIAPRPWRMDTQGVVHCATGLAHGHTGRGALHHGLGAWTHGAWCIAPRPWRMDTRGVVHCTTALAHGHTGRGALLRGRGAWTHGAWCNAPRPWRTDTRDVAVHRGVPSCTAVQRLCAVLALVRCA